MKNLSYQLPGVLDAAVKSTLADWKYPNNLQRLWSGDASLWTGVVKAAQARGDFQVLADRGRRALRIHLGADLEAGLAQLQKAVEQALS